MGSGFRRRKSGLSTIESFSSKLETIPSNLEQSNSSGFEMFLAALMVVIDNSNFEMNGSKLETFPSKSEMIISNIERWDAKVSLKGEISCTCT